MTHHRATVQATLSLLTKVALAILCLLLVDGCSTNTLNRTPQYQWQWFSSDTAKAFQAECKSLLHRANNQLSLLESTPLDTAKQYANTLNQLDITVEQLLGKTRVYRNLHPNTEVRAAAVECFLYADQLKSRSDSSNRIYTHLQQYLSSTPGQKTHDYLQYKYQSATLAGAQLDKKQRKALHKQREKQAKFVSEFRENILEDKKRVTLISESLLDGVPLGIIEALSRDRDGRLSIAPNSRYYFDIMANAKHDFVRKNLYTIRTDRGAPKNKKILRKAVENSYTLAATLGYPSFADLALADTALSSPSEVHTFLKALNTAATPAAEKQYKTYLNFAQQLEPSTTRISSWQKYFYAEQFKKNMKKTANTQEKVFSLDSVIKYLLNTTEQVYDFSITPVSRHMWHKDVKVFRVDDGNKIIGELYFDLYAREGKPNDIRAMTLQKGYADSQLAIAVLSANFELLQSSSTKLSISELDTLIFQYARQLEVILNRKSENIAFTGLPLKHDFSNIYPNLFRKMVWAKLPVNALADKAIDSKADNYATINSIQEAYADSKNQDNALKVRQQLFYASLSLQLFEQEPDYLDIDETALELHDRYSPFAGVAGTCLYCGLSILIERPATYYSFLWTKAVTADLLSFKNEQQLSDREFLRLFSRKLFTPSATIDPLSGLESLLARKLDYTKLF